MERIRKSIAGLVFGLILHIFSIVLTLIIAFNYLNQNNCHPKLPILNISDVRLSNYFTEDLDINYSEFYEDGKCDNTVETLSMFNGSVIKSVKCLDYYDFDQLSGDFVLDETFNYAKSNGNQTFNSSSKEAMLNQIKNRLKSNYSERFGDFENQTPKLRNKYEKIYEKVVGEKSILESVAYGDGNKTTNIWFLTHDPYAYFMISAYIHVFDGNVVSNFGSVCKLNDIPLMLSNADKIVSSFCSVNFSDTISNSIKSISKSIQDLSAEHKQIAINILTTCNVTEYLNALKNTNVFGILFPSGKIKGCYDLIPDYPTISMLRRIKSLKTSVESIVKETGLNFSSNWKEQIYEFLGKCHQDAVEIRCINEDIDDCSYGFLGYGTLTMLPIVLPGMLYAISDFCFHKYFRFCGFLETSQRRNNWLKCHTFLLLPVYAIFMGFILNLLIAIE